MSGNAMNNYLNNDKKSSFIRDFKLSRRQWLGLTACLALGGCAGPPAFSEQTWRQTVEAIPMDMLYAPHRDQNGLFFNPWMERKQGGDWLTVLRWRLFMKNATPEEGQNLPSIIPVLNSGLYLSDPLTSDSLTAIGHCTYALQWTGQVVLFDPFFNNRALVIARDVPPAFGPEALPPKTAVVISHNHYDHLDSDAVELLARNNAVFFCPLGMGAWLEELGAQNINELDWWQSLEHENTTFTFLPAQHWSNRLGVEANSSLWGSWLVERQGRRVFFAGDSGYFIGYKEIGRRYPGINLALLPAGAYLPRWFMHYMHLDITEMFQAFYDLGAEQVVPIHWGAIKLGDGPPAWPQKDIENYLASQPPELKERVRIMLPGSRLSLPPAVIS